VPAADIITPNQFELEFLSGMTIGSLADAQVALSRIHALGPRIILVTSFKTAETPEDAIEMLVSDGTSRFRVRTPLLPLSINGAGDAIAALFFVHYLVTRDAATALVQAASSIYGLLKRTAEAGSREILTVAAQDEFIAPSTIFQGESI
jgi:pyridoxine kinase